jgi:hypothetical protein
VSDRAPSEARAFKNRGFRSSFAPANVWRRSRLLPGMNPRAINGQRPLKGPEKDPGLHITPSLLPNQAAYPGAVSTNMPSTTLHGALPFGG